MFFESVIVNTEDIGFFMREFNPNNPLRAEREGNNWIFTFLDKRDLEKAKQIINGNDDYFGGCFFGFESEEQERAVKEYISNL